MMFFRELFSMCSKSNTKSRGFYIGVVVGLFILFLGCIICVGTSVLGFIQGQITKAIISMVIGIVALLSDIGICFVLNRS